MKGCFSDTYPFKSSLHLKKRQAVTVPVTLKFAWELLQWNQGWIKWLVHRHIAAKHIYHGLWVYFDLLDRTVCASKRKWVCCLGFERMLSGFICSESPAPSTLIPVSGSDALGIRPTEVTGSSMMFPAHCSIWDIQRGLHGSQRRRQCSHTAQMLHEVSRIPALSSTTRSVRCETQFLLWALPKDRILSWWLFLFFF